MLATVDVVDMSRTASVRHLVRPPRVERIDGMRSSTLAIANPLSGSVLPALSVRRLALVAFWEDDAGSAIDAFHATDPTLGGPEGWHLRMEAVRASGTWPGLPDTVASARSVEHEAGPAAVLTLGRLRLRRAVPFVRNGARAQAQALDAPGLVWGSGLARLPFVSSFTLWESADALRAYAYGAVDAAHAQAMAADARLQFHHQGAFVRFRPTMVRGSLGGTNPLGAGDFAPLTPAAAPHGRLLA